MKDLTAQEGREKKTRIIHIRRIPMRIDGCRVAMVKITQYPDGSGLVKINAWKSRTHRLITLAEMVQMAYDRATKQDVAASKK